MILFALVTSKKFYCHVALRYEWTGHLLFVNEKHKKNKIHGYDIMTCTCDDKTYIDSIYSIDE